MKMTNLFALGLLGFGIWMFIRKSSVAKNVLFSFEKLDADIRKQKILMTMGVYNPTTTPIEFNSVVGALLLNGKQIALVESFQKTTISATAKTNILITLRPSVVGILQTIQDIVKAKLKGIKLSASFVGSANVDGITFPVETKLA